MTTAGPSLDHALPGPRGKQLVTTDDLFYTRFNRRSGLAIRAALFAYPFLFLLVCVSQTVSAPVMLVHLASYAMVVAFLWFTRERDSAMVFIVTHVFWFYCFLLFLYAILHWKSPETDLYAPLLSALVAATALLASIAGYLIAQTATRVIGLPRKRPPPPPVERARLGLWLIAIGLPLTLLPLAGRTVPILNAIGGLFDPVLWLGLLVYCRGRGTAAAREPIVLLIIVVEIAVSIRLNARSDFLSLGLVLGVAYLGIARHPFRLSRLIGLYLLANAASALSYVMLAGRTLAGHEASASIVLAALQTPSFYLAILGFDTLGGNVAIVNNELARHDHYLLYMFDGRLGIFERLTEMPHMDIVLSRQPWPVPVDWYEIKNALLSSLPSIGQQKDLIYNDRLAWDARLILDGVVGHPLVTATGEFYAMGGFITLFVIFSLMMAATLYLYEVSRRVFRDRFVAAGALIFSTLFMVMSSTSVSALAVPLRIYPAMLAVFVAVDFARRASASRNGRPRRAATAVG